MRALGMIETLGLIPSIEALDAMLKAANVETLEKTNVRGGIVAVLVIGDVAAAKAAVDAGAAAAERVSPGALISQHVIPRPDSQIEVLFKNNKKMQDNMETAEDAGRTENFAKETSNGGQVEDTVTAEEVIVSNIGAEATAGQITEAESETVITPETEPEVTVVLHTRAELEAFLKEQGLEKLMQVIKHMRNSEMKKLAKGYKAGELQVDKNARATKAELIDKLHKFYSKEVNE